MEDLISIQGITKSFGGIRAVNDISMLIAKGELRCLIGPNGAGKSTLFSLISGLQKADNGAILFNGENITRLEPYRRVRKGICQKFQTTRIYRSLTVDQNIVIAKSLHSEASKNGPLEWALDSLGLRSNLNRLAGELPHSQQQWLEICMVIATEPTLILLDEPTAGMSPDETAATAKFVLELNRLGMTIIVVEHDMAFVRQIARKITVMHYGAIFAEGVLADIEQNNEVKRIYLGEQ